MEKDGQSVFQYTADEHRGAHSGQPMPGGIGHSIRPGVPVPATVLVAEMQDGSLLLHGWQGGPNAYVVAEDAGPLRRELATAFGSMDVAAPGESR